MPDFKTDLDVPTKLQNHIDDLVRTRDIRLNDLDRTINTMIEVQIGKAQNMITNDQEQDMIKWLYSKWKQNYRKSSICGLI
jgi:hypothetical protein